MSHMYQISLQKPLQAIPTNQDEGALNGPIGVELIPAVCRLIIISINIKGETP